MSLICSDTFFTNKENYIYYRNLFIRFFKETNRYDLFKSKTKSIDRLDKLIKDNIPEHWMNCIFLYDEYRDFSTEYMQYLSLHSIEKHRIEAEQLFESVLNIHKINKDRINELIHKGFRHNLGFRCFEDSIFSDNKNRCVDDVVKNSPISLIPFYMIEYKYYSAVSRDWETVINKWMYNYSKQIYNY